MRALTQSGLFPTNCRLLDAGEAELNQASGGSAHILVLGIESVDHQFLRAGRVTMIRLTALARSKESDAQDY